MPGVALHIFLFDISEQRDYMVSPSRDALKMWCRATRIMHARCRNGISRSFISGSLTGARAVAVLLLSKLSSL